MDKNKLLQDTITTVCPLGVTTQIAPYTILTNRGNVKRVGFIFSTDTLADLALLLFTVSINGIIQLNNANAMQFRSIGENMIKILAVDPEMWEEKAVVTGSFVNGSGVAITVALVLFYD